MIVGVPTALTLIAVGRLLAWAARRTSAAGIAAWLLPAIMFLLVVAPLAKAAARATEQPDSAPGNSVMGNGDKRAAAVAVVLVITAVALAAIAGWLTSQHLCPSAQSFPDSGFRTAAGILAAMALLLSGRFVLEVATHQRKSATRWLLGASTCSAATA